MGKTAFINNCLAEMSAYPQIRTNLSSPTKTHIDGIEYFGRDLFGNCLKGVQPFLQNISFVTGDLAGVKKAVIVFIDEADKYAPSLELIQDLAGLSNKLKVIYTGSNLENLKVDNAATGRKRYFDLYPLTFLEFLRAHSKEVEIRYLNQISLKDKKFSEMLHNELNRLFGIYMRLGGMPRIVDNYLDKKDGEQPLPQLISNIVTTIEENVKSVLEEKASLYEYEDVLRRLALLSMETLKFSKLQVQHIKRNEAKRLVGKTVGARVAHKIRLFESATDLSKYIIFDAGVLNYLLNGSDIMQTRMSELNAAIQYETAVGNEIIAGLSTRDDIFYWKSKRGAQVEYVLKSPFFTAIDVKSTRGDSKSLESCAVFEKDLEYMVKISKERPSVNHHFIASIPASSLSRRVPLITIPHYLSSRLQEMLKELV
ncbi:MAG: AAA family ATPase [Deltaproteobacteria bacterium]|nr:AAA family ATPase [Deltaproteobacteria bacterium]